VTLEKVTQIHPVLKWCHQNRFTSRCLYRGLL